MQDAAHHVECRECPLSTLLSTGLGLTGHLASPAPPDQNGIKPLIHYHPSVYRAHKALMCTRLG